MIELVALDEIDLIREVYLPVIRPSQGCSWADSKTSKAGVFVHLMVKYCTIVLETTMKLSER